MCRYMCCLCKRKPAYELRIGDWSSDVCSSDRMLRSRDSLAIAGHAAGLGWIDPARLREITAEVQRGRARPTLGEAAASEAGHDVMDQAKRQLGAAKPKP